jgi:hypothetical protein
MNLEKIVWITPSRERPEKLERLINSWRDTTSGLSDLLVCYDSDDHSYDNMMEKYEDVIWCVNEGETKSFLRILNNIALICSDQYQYLGFMEDDCIFETKDYEQKFIDKLKVLGPYGIVFANDLLNTPKLITLPVLNSNIVKDLGFYCPDELNCLFADNYWRELATSLNSEYYFEDIIIKHLHYTVENSECDSTSISVDHFMPIDAGIYHRYMSTKFQNDLSKLKRQ